MGYLQPEIEIEKIKSPSKNRIAVSMREEKCRSYAPSNPPM
jgi:hypothetical protein